MKTIELRIVKKNNPLLQKAMETHYSQPKGFVGRQIIYQILHNNISYGFIAGGSATLFLPGRNEFFNIEKKQIQSLINNVFFHIEKQNHQYPFRNFGQTILTAFEKQIPSDWTEKYKMPILGFETLVELPRTGEIYTRNKWTHVGTTKGYTCKRVAGKGTDSWSGKRTWNTQELKPKLVFCKKLAVDSSI